VIAPVDEMVGDTITVKARFEDLEKTIKNCIRMRKVRLQATPITEETFKRQRLEKAFI
jgi:hypothetical protein